MTTLDTAGTAAPSGSLEPRRLWLVPRGDTTWDRSRLLAGQDRRPLLTEGGRFQAELYARLLGGARVTRVFVADLRADVQTARPLARATKAAVSREPRLRGRSLGLACGVPRDALGPQWTGVDDGVVVDADVAPPGGETVRQVYRRVSRFLAELLGAELDGDIALVADREALAVAVGWLDGTGPHGIAWPARREDLLVGRTVAARVPVARPMESAPTPVAPERAVAVGAVPVSAVAVSAVPVSAVAVAS